jgi:hypothetical protein
VRWKDLARLACGGDDMPRYKCLNKACGTGGNVIKATKPRDKCPTCGQKTLERLPDVVLVRTAITQWREAASGGGMDNSNGEMRAIAHELIDQWTITGVTTAEAGKKKDWVYTARKTNKYRIDREEPVMSGMAVTHAKYRLQINADTLAGIWVPVDTTVDFARVRLAWVASLTDGNYKEIFVE